MRRHSPLTLLPLLASAVLVPASCREPTEITIELSTDVPCENVTATGIYVGSSHEATSSFTQTERCSSGDIGTLVLIPSGDDDAELAITVILGAGKTPEECQSALVKSGCVLAKRSIRFKPHSPLTLPIHLSSKCLGKSCAANETCDEGACVPLPGSVVGPDASMPDASSDGPSSDADDPDAGGSALPNESCADGKACASGVCFDFAGSIGKRCVEACGSSNDCPAEFTCYPYQGAKLCAHKSLFANATFEAPAGATCASGSACASNYCGPASTCVGTCAHDSDCSTGPCAWREVSSDNYLGVCTGPVGAKLAGATCANDGECVSGACYGAGTCGALCGSTADCSPDTFCGHLNYSVCLFEVFSVCEEWQVNFVTACVEGVFGNDPIGSPCTDASTCRDGICNATAGSCTGACATTADCPATHVCGPIVYGDLDGTTVHVNVCVPRP